MPFCRTRCRYCGFYSELLDRHDPAALVDGLKKELSAYPGLDRIWTVYIGGGSPSALPSELLLDLVGTLARTCPKTGEFTVECNPGQADGDLFKALLDAGVNRLSMGAQSFNPEDLAVLGRTHSVEDVERAVDKARQAGLENLSLDLIFAVPGSTLETWERSLKAAIGLAVPHLSAYALTLEPDTALALAVRSGQVAPIDEDTDRAMYLLAIDRLEVAGLAQYEISNFARPGFQCTHNLGYWYNHPFIGIGPSAASFRHGRRTRNIGSVQDYLDRMARGVDLHEESEACTPEAWACETAVLALRMRTGLDLAGFKATTGLDAEQAFSEPIERFRRAGLMEIQAGRLRLTAEGLPIADSILSEFATL